jgi:biotin transport system substrate-specific component
VVADSALVLGGAGLVAAAAQISIGLPFTPVPITGQTFAVVLVGAGLGTVRGFASLFLYLWLGVAGAPIYAHHTNGGGTAGSPPRSARC